MIHDKFTCFQVASQWAYGLWFITRMLHHPLTCPFNCIGSGSARGGAGQAREAARENEGKGIAGANGGARCGVLSMPGRRKKSHRVTGRFCSCVSLAHTQRESERETQWKGGVACSRLGSKHQATPAPLKHLAATAGMLLQCRGASNWR